MAAARRLPGIDVVAAAPAATEALPRMDVAVLVGFAATGPLHVPVVVESVAEYAAVFGGDTPLAWDAARGERVLAHLGAAVRAFFANGGRRCWVIRVARSRALEAVRALRSGVPASDVVATANRFALAGVLEVSRAGVMPALAQARCEGSWSDALRVATAASQRAIAVDAFAPAGSPSSDRFTLRVRAAVRLGAVVAFGESVVAFAVVDGVRAAAGSGYDLAIRLCAVFEPLGPAAVSPPSAAGSADIEGFGTALAATLHAPIEADADGIARARIEIDTPLPAALEPGHWVRWSDGGAPVWLSIDTIARRPAFAGSPAAADSGTIFATVSGPAWREGPVEWSAAFDDVNRVRVASLDVQVTAGDAAHDFRLSGIGLAPGHVAAWWSQRTDADFYRAPDPSPADDRDRREARRATERFPLACSDGEPPVAWLPLAVGPLFGPAPAALPQSATALERDGLSAFDAGLFLDPELAGDGVAGLVAHADDIRLLRADARPLFGIHAALAIGAAGLFDEATLIAVPDAVHVGWRRSAVEPVDAVQPSAGAPPAHWTTHRGPCARTPSPAEADAAPGPDFGRFLDCATRDIESPVLFGPDAPIAPGAFRLSWTDAEPGGTYVLFEASESDFGDRREVYRGTDTEHVIVAALEALLHYRVFATAGDESSAGSNVVSVRVRADEWLLADPRELPESFEDEWLAIHRALLRLAAAGGHLFAVLSMPRHFRVPQAQRYAQRLRSVRRPPGPAERDAFGFDEARALSFGALYFPWLQSDARIDASGERAAARQLRVVPPDGVAIGVLAARAWRRGAWIAAANEPLKDVVALAPDIAAADRQTLQDAQINLLRADPRGFFALSADTLALDDDAELRPINVRRLLTLLRRLALRRGTRYVFEPNGPTLRRAVQRGFDLLLGDLFERGAFAGATAAQSFRVVTDDTINTPRAAEAGRFLVELRVAPSIPMRFIAVRLTQTGERLAVVEEL